ncbi:PleD family two-component system response regulator [Pseudomonadota bacterium]
MPISKILVVDDAATDRMNLQKILSDAGYQVVAAASGVEALEKASSEKPDLIFLDIVMESMDGYQACRKLSKGEVTKNIPIIMVSSKNQEVDKLWAQKQGAVAYICKPYTADDITDQIQKLQ